MKTIVRNNIEKIDRHRKWLFWMCASLFFLFAALYVYFVNTTTLNGVRWREAEQQREALAGALPRLESAYFSLAGRVTLSLAQARGFQEARGVRFVTARTLGVVSQNNDL